MYVGERFNSFSHLLGTILAVIGTVLLLMKAMSGGARDVVAASIYGATLIVLYAASTLYHSSRSANMKSKLQKVDHCVIYLLIAGSYTPYTLITLHGTWGWTILAIIWVLAAIGIVQELFIQGAWQHLSVVIYLSMGWLVLFVIVPVVRALPTWGLVWLVIGGAIYTVGVYWFINDEKIPHGHGIWHLFVLGGSIAQYISIYGWVIAYRP